MKIYVTIVKTDIKGFEEEIIYTGKSLEEAEKMAGERWESLPEKAMNTAAKRNTAINVYEFETMAMMPFSTTRTESVFDGWTPKDGYVYKI